MDNRRFVRCGAPAAACRSSAHDPVRVVSVYSFGFPSIRVGTILCVLLGLRLAILGCMRGHRRRAERGAEATLVYLPFPL